MNVKYNCVDWLQNEDSEVVKKISRNNTKDYDVAAFNVKGDLNLGSIIRSSLYFNCRKLWYFRDRKFDRRYCVGTQNYLDFEYVSKEFDDWIHENNIYPVFIEQGGVMLRPGIFKAIYTSRENKKMCLIFGNESEGIKKEILQKHSKYPIISVPTYNVAPRSLGVATTVPIILYQVINEID